MIPNVAIRTLVTKASFDPRGLAPRHRSITAFARGSNAVLIVMLAR
jgi:hypothetical protein